MKQYKLIKEYPGSLKLNVKIHRNFETGYGYSWVGGGIIHGGLTDEHVYNNPEFWEEIVEKDYEVLAIIGNTSGIIYNLDGNKFIDKDGYKITNFPHNNSGCKILTVKRLYDNQIFIVGDDILEQNEHSKIEYFELRGDDLVLRINHQVTKGSSTIDINSKFEKYVPKDYEILSFRDKNGTGIFKSALVIRTSKNLFGWEFNQTAGYSTEEDMLLTIEQNVFEIHSVKRLSDGEVFTIGDKIENIKYDTVRGNINKIILEDGYIQIWYKCNTNSFDRLENIYIITNPLFKTEDGVDIFVGDTIYCVSLYSFALWNGKMSTTNYRTYYHKRNKTFSTKEAAEEYIIMNKPCLSLEDVYGCTETHSMTLAACTLTKLVKSRICQ